MSQTTERAGSVRYAPDRGHRDTAPVPVGAALGGLTTALIMGGVAMRTVGWELGLPLVGVTAVVTLAAVALWRWSLPRLISVTVSPEAVVYRRYGRVRTLCRDDRLRSAVRVVPTTGLFEVDRTYLVLWGTGDPILLNHGIWSQDDTHAIASAAPAGRRDDEPRRRSARDLAREVPGAVPFTMAHPHLTGVVLAAVAVVVTGLALWLVPVLADDDTATQDAVAPSAPRRQDLPNDTARKQDEIFQGTLAALPGSMGPREFSSQDCGPAGGWQRVLRATSDQQVDLSTVRARVSAVADQNGLSLDPGTGDAAISFSDPDTSASLTVASDGSGSVLTSASDCVLPE